MKAVLWQGGMTFEIENVPESRPGPEQVIVKVEAAAICGSDLHLQDFGMKPPLIPGHEVAGTVAETGEGVTEFTVGDHVALDPVMHCGKCWCCTHGIEHLCVNVRHLGWLDVPGGWAQYVAIDAANAHRIPDNVDFPAACLVEVLAVCYQSFQRANMREGDTVLVLGDGPFGFLHVQIAKAHGAGIIVVAGHYDERLSRIAAATGAVTCNTHRQELSSVLADKVNSIGVDVAVEATGSGASPNIAIEALRPRGSLVIFSYIWKSEPLAMDMIHLKELNILGACRSLNAYGACLDLLSEGKVNTNALIDMKVSLEACPAAIEKVKTHKKDIFKAVLLPWIEGAT